MRGRTEKGFTVQRYERGTTGGDGHIDARDLIAMIKGLGEGADAFFEFARFWMGVF